MTEQIGTVFQKGILTITLDRPEKKNALTDEMYLGLSDALSKVEEDPAIKVAVITGSGGDFTAGNDLQDFLASPPEDESAPAYRFLESIGGLTAPLIAAVDGMAIGVGTTMLFHCDFVYATPRTIFRLPFVDLGLIPEAAATMLLPRLTGHIRAAELLMLAKPFDVQVAGDIGLVSEVIEPEVLLDHAQGTARQLAAKPRAALRHTKALLRAPEEPVLDRMHREMLIFAECLRSDAAKEAMAAVLEKRKPDLARFD